MFAMSHDLTIQQKHYKNSSILYYLELNIFLKYIQGEVITLLNYVLILL
jgi:hypothetical protein